MTKRKLPVSEAAEVLGISQDAVRMRIKRDTLEAERVGRRLFVLLNTELTTDPTHPDAAALISEMRARVDDLREQLEQANERDRENRRIIAALTQRIPAIEAPQETPEPPETATDMPMGPPLGGE